MDKQHIIYKITNTLNNRFYVGMHTGYPNDGYLGSGKRIKSEIKKYGKENFKKEILELLPSRKDLKQREAEIVNEELLANPLCLNLKNGGEGGWKFGYEIELKRRRGLSKALTGRKLSDTQKQSITNSTRGNKRCAPAKSTRFSGKTHTKETLAKMRESHRGKQAGEKNSQFGTCWVTNGRPLKIKKEQLDEYLANGYSRGRKMAL